jgi:hypothetical protein
MCASSRVIRGGMFNDVFQQLKLNSRPSQRFIITRVASGKFGLRAGKLEFNTQTEE